VACTVIVHLTRSVVHGCLLETTRRWHCGVRCEGVARPVLAHGARLGLTSVFGHTSRTGGVRTARPIKQCSTSSRCGDRWHASDRWRIGRPRLISGGHVHDIG
jgi:hypothetical protein